MLSTEEMDHCELSVWGGQAEISGSPSGNTSSDAGPNGLQEACCGSGFGLCANKRHVGRLGQLECVI